MIPALDPQCLASIPPGPAMWKFTFVSSERITGNSHPYKQKHLALLLSFF